MSKAMVIGLKPLPKPARQTDLLKQQDRVQMEREIFEVIARRVPFSVDQLEWHYRSNPSFDLLIAACEHFAAQGIGLLKLPDGFVMKVHCPKCDTVVGLARGENDR